VLKTKLESCKGLIIKLAIKIKKQLIKRFITNTSKRTFRQMFRTIVKDTLTTNLEIELVQKRLCT
jgi:hypothetical protein